VINYSQNMSFHSVRSIVLVTVLVLLASSCSTDNSSRNASLTIPKQTLPKLTVTPTTEGVDPASELDYRNWGRGPGLPSGGSFGTTSSSDCAEKIYKHLGSTDEGVSRILYLVTMYNDANDGYIDCSDGGQTWEEIQDWVSKLIHVPIPQLKLEVQGYPPTISSNPANIVKWRESVELAFPFPEPGTIFAEDIDPATRRGTPWILDSMSYRTRSGRNGRVSSLTTSGPRFTYSDSVSLNSYRDNDPKAYFSVAATASGVRPDGQPSRTQITFPFEKFNLANLVVDDSFVVVGFGDSYGSGEGNPGSDEGWSDRGFFQSDENTNLNPDNLWWPEGELSEFSVNTEYHDHCHRSSKSGLAKAIQLLGDRYTGEIKYGHFACSGAVTENIWIGSYVPDFWGYERSQRPQIDQANDWLATNGLSPLHVDAVVVSAGGNDTGFSDVIYDCFIEAGDCYNETDTLNYFNNIWNVISQKMDNMVMVAAQMYPNAKIFYTSYTDGISVSKRNPGDKDRWWPNDPKDGVCSDNDDPWHEWVENDTDELWDIRTEDSKFLVKYLNKINESLKKKADSLFLNGSQEVLTGYLASHFSNTPEIVVRTPTFAGKGRVYLIDGQFTNNRNNGFCAGSSKRNIMFNNEAGEKQGSDQYQYWSSGGWHPNDLGYRQYGDAIAEALARNFRETAINLRRARR